MQNWSELTIKDLAVAYRKAKADCFFERSFVGAELFVQYEEQLQQNLTNLLNELVAEKTSIAKVLQKYKGTTQIVAKKLTRQEKKHEGPTGRAHSFFSEPVRNVKKLQNSFSFTPEFRMVGIFPVEMHLLSSLWLNTVGHKFDARLTGAARGNRLRRYGSANPQALAELSEYHETAIGSFDPYYLQYRRWREDGLRTIRSELVASQPVVVLSLDFANYFHTIDPRFISMPEFQRELGVELTQWEKQFTVDLATSLHEWSVDSDKDIESLGCTPPNPPLGLPIGLSAVRVIANVFLHRLDYLINSELAPLYYGRYVDDLFIVLRDPKSIQSAEELFLWISKRIKEFEVKSSFGGDPTSQNEITVQFAPDYGAASSISLQPSKQKIFFLEGPTGLDFLSTIEAEIRQVSSERRLMPDPIALSVLAQRENEDWKLVEEGRFRPTGGDFQGIRVYRSDRGSCG